MTDEFIPQTDRGTKAITTQRTCDLLQEMSTISDDFVPYLENNMLVALTFLISFLIAAFFITDQPTGLHRRVLMAQSWAQPTAFRFTGR